MTTKTKIPALRFPQFEGEWVEKKLGEMTHITAGGTPSTAKKEYWKNGDIRWMNSGELNLKRVYEVGNRITAEGLKNSSTKIVPKHSVLIGLAGQGKTRGTVAMNMIELCTNQSVASLLPNEKVYTSDFLYWNLDFRYEELRGLSTGEGGRGGLNLQIIKSLKVSFPSLPEQQKVAEFLSSVDEQIQQLKAKKSKLEEYKKGAMQKIFSQQLRFKDEKGNDYPEWEEKKLGDICKKSMYGLNTPAIFYDGINGYLRITDINETNNLFEKEGLTSPKEYDESYLLSESDLLFARTGASVGKSYLYKKEDGRLFFAGFLIKFTVINAIPKFIFYCTLLESFRKWVKIMSARSGQPGINAEEYSSLLLSLPSLPEQQKIADFLSAIDDRIALCDEEIAKSEQYKKGLLQQMFV